MINAQEPFTTSGKQTDKINVRISHRIIQLFSEGLYSSPNKAIEELVANSFDAGARNVNVILSSDLTSPDATIAVIDDGESMDVAGLKQHWIIGQSKRREGKVAYGRKPIGKFGIGKLATYVLASHLTHICKIKGKYYAATMDYTQIAAGDKKDTEEAGVFHEEHVTIPLRTLTKTQAQDVLKPWISGSKPGYKALSLFGSGASETWTVAIMSGLTDMGQRIQRKRLYWILRSAMPLRDDFYLFCDGIPIESTKIDIPIIERWIIGKDITDDNLKKPCPDGFSPTEEEGLPIDDIKRYGLSHERLGRVTGYVELYESDLSGGKSDELERSNGYFVYVRERLINTDDPGFGIERNLLRHGTFSRFRMVVHIDSLDDILRSSRESLLQGELYTLTKDFLHAVFNLARNRLVEYEVSQTPGAIISSRISSTPGSLTRKPMLSLVVKALKGTVFPRYTRLPKGLNEEEQREFVETMQIRVESEAGMLSKSELVELDARDGIAVYEAERGVLQINTSHPFVAAFYDVFVKPVNSLPLEMYAVAEILMEANLYQMDFDPSDVQDILAFRDELLRQFVRSSAKRTAGMIALAILDAKEDANKLEEEMKAGFEAMGFGNVVKLGGSGKPEGTAEAFLPAAEDGTLQRYKVGLEAKSGGVVSAKKLGVSGLERHIKDNKIDHHLVIGNSFHTAKEDTGATEKEINSFVSHTGKTITLMCIDDFARLVRLVPAKRIGLRKLRNLFQTCIRPQESHEWVNKIASETPPKKPHREILETIWERAGSRPSEPVEYGTVMTALELGEHKIIMSKQEIIECCKSMQAMAVGVIFAKENTVELERRPDLVLADIHAALDSYPEAERSTIII